MHLVDFPVPGFLHLLSLLVALTALLFAVWVAPWRAVIHAPERQHLLFGTVIVMILLWLMKITWVEGFFIHPMGMTAVTVIFGWRLAVFIGFVIMLAFEILGSGQWITMPMDYILTVLVPATVTFVLIRRVQSLQSRNLFVFMLGVGFVGAMLGFLVNLLLILLLALVIGHQLFVDRLFEAFPLIIMLLNLEGFLNGAVVTAMSVFAPHLVKSLDERKFLGG